MGLRECLVLGTMLCMTGPAMAQGTTRCGGHVVDQGMSKEDVSKLCGMPTVTKQAGQYWFYDHGSELVTRVFFVDNQVEFIDEVSRDEM